MTTTRLGILLAGLICAAVTVPDLFADSLRVLPAGEIPCDARTKALKNLEGYFPFQVPATPAAWERRRVELRQRVLVATGLWPMPRKTPLNAVTHGRVQRDGFTVEKVYFESIPGHFVTGLLFRPEGTRGRLPGVLCPHGHGGRLQDHGRHIRQVIVEGRERFEGSGRFPKLARCAQLARMGCVTFIYDMLGYADSLQIHNDIAHDLRRPRPHLEHPEKWGFFTAQAELRLQSSMGLQAYNSIRALDFLCSLPDVDPQRVGVTGSSGGGTQSFILCAIDPRPIVAFPQGMVSTAMQGGCLCENASLLRIGTGNVELAALFAPKPMGMTAAGDWTGEMMSKGYPELQRLYELLGAKENVFCKSLNHFPHNYNYVTRAVMYSWFNKHLDLGLPEPIVEGDFPPLTPEEYTVWNDEHPAPRGGEEYEVALTKWLDEESQRLLEEVHPRSPESLEQYRRVVGGALETIVGRGLPARGSVTRKEIAKGDRGAALVTKNLLRLGQHREELPVVWFYPTAVDWNGELVVWVDGRGKESLVGATGEPRLEVKELLVQGFAIAGLDLFQQGEFLHDGQQLKEARANKGSRPSAVFTFCYNHPLFVRRVHDILTLVAFVRDDERSARIHLVGAGGAGPIVAVASALLGDVVARRAIDTEGFRFGEIRSYRDVNFLPGAVKYGDLPAILALSAPHPLWIAGEGDTLPDVLEDAYRASRAPGNLHRVDRGLRQLVRDTFYASSTE